MFVWCRVYSLLVRLVKALKPHVPSRASRLWQNSTLLTGTAQFKVGGDSPVRHDDLPPSETALGTLLYANQIRLITSSLLFPMLRGFYWVHDCAGCVESLLLPMQ